MNKFIFKRAVKVCGNQSRLAERLEVTRQYISAIGKGTKNPKDVIDAITKIAEELKSLN